MGEAWRRGWCVVTFAVVFAGCSHAPVTKVPAAENTRYVDSQLGFEISRPDQGWQVDVQDTLTAEGVAIPVVMRQPETGAQVMLQVAPAVASPTQFAERLNRGMQRKPGVVLSETAPLPLSDDSVGFGFAMAEGVAGRVAVLRGGSGQVFLMVATWPVNAHGSEASVEEIFASLRAVPVRPG
jgi:hypothetical protein